MINQIKRRLLHFTTDGSIISDFVAVRQRRAGVLRRVLHACFYVHCALSTAALLWCCISGAAVYGAVAAAVTLVLAFFALGGTDAVKTALYVMDCAAAVAGFVLGAYAGGVLYIAAALAAVGMFGAGYFRAFLLDFSPVMLTRDNYTLSAPERAAEPPAEPVPEPVRSDMETLADSLMEILK